MNSLKVKDHQKNSSLELLMKHILTSRMVLSERPLNLGSKKTWSPPEDLLISCFQGKFTLKQMHIIPKDDPDPVLE